MTLYSEKIYYTTEQLNLVRAFTGIFFGVQNLIFACGVKNALSYAASDFFSCSMASIAALSTLSVIIWKIYHHDNSVTSYEKIIFIIARMGVVCCALNIAQFNDDFTAAIEKNNATKITYAAVSFFIAAFAILSEPLQKLVSKNSTVISSFVSSSSKSGAWGGAIFSWFLTESIVIKHEKTTTEINVFAFLMGGLLTTEWMLSYATLIKKISAEDAKTFIETPLEKSASQSEKMIWWLSFILDLPRASLAFFVSVMAIPNILALSPSFVAATEGIAQRRIYGALAGSSLLCGINNGAKIVSTRFKCNANVAPADVIQP